MFTPAFIFNLGFNLGVSLGESQAQLVGIGHQVQAPPVLSRAAPSWKMFNTSIGMGGFAPTGETSPHTGAPWIWRDPERSPWLYLSGQRPALSTGKTWEERPFPHASERRRDCRAWRRRATRDGLRGEDGDRPGDRLNDYVFRPEAKMK